MPPKKQNRGEGGLTPAQEKKQAAAKAKAEEAAAREQERLDEIKADPLVVRHSDATPALSVSHVFSKVITRKDFKMRKPESGRCDFDWTSLRERLQGRTAESPLWFIHLRSEDLILEPDGLDGETVEVAVIVEATEPTLAPMHMVVREARPFSDLEDNTPERIVKLADQGFVWQEVRADDGSSINVFLLQEKRKPAAAGADAVGKSFSFGGAAPKPAAAAAPKPAGFGVPAAEAPKPAGFGASAASSSQPTTPAVTTGFGGTPSPSVQGAAAAAAALAAASGAGSTGFGNAPKTASFGFGGAAPAAAAAAPAAPAKTASFGFGSGATQPAAATAAPATFGGRAVSPKPAQIPQVGFGANAAPAPSAAAPVANSSGFASGFGASKDASGNKSATDKVALENVQFTLWTEKRLKEMKKEIAAGSRIVIEGFQLPAPINRKIKLQMQNDLKDTVEDAVDFVIRKEFARQNEAMKVLDAWLDECPVYDPKFADAIQKFRDGQLDEAIEESGSDALSYAAIDKALRPMLTAELEARVADRKAMLQKESDEIDDIITLVKKKKLLATKDTFRIIKLYPKNDRLKFRPFGKVGGVHEAGEGAHECIPAPYVAKNVFAAKVAAMHAA